MWMKIAIFAVGSDCRSPVLYAHYFRFIAPEQFRSSAASSRWW
jgi:hypothetical protein